ncbi:LSU ribosomal protein L15P [Rubritalea squalenifaciens DSM 18772]|uniref:Large ribosomal subunit protein uL15 n=1 Tax=Rubritalea squalenifaciens DSM 18772 TaxID=1123071 RepID=A0A1M6RTE2_9BACT|nr:50S ribosomal protein L15 [Rubritalea squalenifaciens]SHK35771.1 LSU ribosomal protein L15P [Rubritalea squalenifaciens DSM 18772]
MNLHNLKPNPGAKHRNKRLGKGESSGLGKTSGKGHKGQKARSGSGVRVGFEGGQMPLHRRLPKRGFNNIRFADKVVIVNTAHLEKFFAEGDTVNEESLREKGLIRGQFDQIKVLGNGQLNKKLTVSVDAISASAKEKIEKAGGAIA